MRLVIHKVNIILLLLLESLSFYYIIYHVAERIYLVVLNYWLKLWSWCIRNDSFDLSCMTCIILSKFESNLLVLLFVSSIKSFIDDQKWFILEVIVFMCPWTLSSWFVQDGIFEFVRFNIEQSSHDFRQKLYRKYSFKFVIMFLAACRI